MISNSDSKEAYVWIWLPNQTDPVVAGKVETYDNQVYFNYGRSYLARASSNPTPISIYEPELPLRAGAIPLGDHLAMPACIRDAAPDAWGRRVVINKLLGAKGVGIDTAKLSEITYLLESGSDRIGALDFQKSATEYQPRQSQNASLEELLESASRVERGVSLTEELGMALFDGTAIGGARPKALIQDDSTKYIAKFSSSTDISSVVKAEFIAMELAAKCGLNVAKVKLVKAAGKDVLLIERFDRTKTKSGWTRKAMVSALTLFGFHDLMARYASYEDLAKIIRHRFVEPKKNLRELYSRMVFNILCGNTDDHARNHAAFWNGQDLDLTPAYDICPQERVGGEASQAMLISGIRNLSKLSYCLEAAHHFLLDKNSGREIIESLKAVIETNWAEVCEKAEVNEIERKLMWRRQFLNPFAFEGSSIR